MSRPIAIRGAPEPLAEDMGAVPGQPYAPSGDGAHEYAGCLFGTILGTDAFARVKGWLGIGEQPPGQPARLNLARPFGAGNHISLPIEPRQKPGSGFAKCFRFSPCALFHARNRSMEGLAVCAEKLSVRCVK